MSFAILTANENEEMAVNSYLQLDDTSLDEKFRYAKGCVWREDAFLKAKKVKIVNLKKYEGDKYHVFRIRVGKVMKMGVHFYCDSYGPTGAFDTTVDILKIAKDKKWTLRWIFLVGCCGASVREDKKKDFPRGTVLLADHVKEYLHTGKAETVPSDVPNEAILKCRIKGNPLPHIMDNKWLREVKKARMVVAKNVDDKRSYNVIGVQRVPYLCGPLVIKDCMFGTWFRERDAGAAGIEMEVVGVINAVKAIHKYTRTPVKEHPQILLAKGISDYTGGKGKTASCMFFGTKTRNVSDDALQVYATLQSTALVIRFVAKKIGAIFEYTS